MIMQKKKLSELKPSTYNPREISPEQLQALEDSMSRFGYVEPIVWNKKSGNICGGHQRYKVLAKTMSQESEVDVVVVDLDEFQEKTLNLALNKISGDWEEHKLAELLNNIKNQDLELLKYTGFNDQEIVDLLKQEKLLVDQEETFDTETALIKPPKYEVKQGDVWQLGNHRLMCADSTKEEDVNKLMNDEKANIVFTSPPYNVGHNLGYSKDSKYLQIDNNNDWIQLIEKSFKISLNSSNYTFYNLQFLANNKKYNCLN